MPILAVQLNHPGAEKPYKLGKGYNYFQNKLIREWNSDAIHYRKFLLQNGEYITSPGQQPMKDELYFWGEWEGNSYFEPLDGRNPNGIHQPFHSLHIRNHQNTDPYVFGDRFFYAVCKQRGQLHHLDRGSMILFGSSFKSGFALDTVFIVKKSTPVHEVARNLMTCVSGTYREATLEQLGETYTKPDSNSLLRLYESETYRDNQHYFSYVPCTPKSMHDGSGFKRFIIPFDNSVGLNFSSNPTGWKVLGAGENSCRELYAKLNLLLDSSGLHKGIQLTEPE